jgi:magnesium chelatase subunit H
LRGLSATGAELDALMRALGGGYLLPAPGADPVRSGAAALPSGRNIHSIDPWRLPSDGAVLRGSQMAEQLLASHVASTGSYPETVGMPLWALDTIKTEGESIAAVLALVGARPERDDQGKIWRYELIPLGELGRPRIDILLDISSIFRDTFQLSLDLLDDLFRRAAAADEPSAQNFVRAHVLALVAEGHSWEQATARIFTQAPGKYGTGVDALVEESAWEHDTDLAETYVQRGSHTYGGGRAGTAAPEVLRGLLKTVAHVFQAIDSVEYGLTDMQHYYGHSGAIQLAARRERGSAVPLSYAETYTGSVKVSAAAELLQIEARTKLLNPKWYEGMLAHGFAGAAEIGNRFSYVLGWSATTGAVDGWVYQGMAETFVLDAEMRQRIEAANPRAARNAVARLLEAHGRGLWAADDGMIAQLQEIYADLEDRLEGASAAV